MFYFKKKRLFLKCVILLIGMLFIQQNGYSQYAEKYNYPDSTFIKAHSPHKATFLSALVPGLGQIYNKAYWKVPVLYAGFTGLGYYASYNNQIYKKYQRELLARTDGDPNTESTLPEGYTNESIISQRDTWRRYRDLCYIGIGLLYVAQIIDADVDAHLFDYDISEDLSMRVEPVMLDTRTLALERSPSPIGIRCTIKF